MTMTYCNCGHEPAVLVRNGQVCELEEGGLVLGVDPRAKYRVNVMELKDGDCLLFYTDGLVDAVNFDDDVWGKTRMLDIATKFDAGSAKQMVRSILGHRRRFVGLARQIDDTSIIVVKVDRTAEPDFMKRAEL